MMQVQINSAKLINYCKKNPSKRKVEINLSKYITIKLKFTYNNN